MRFFFRSILYFIVLIFRKREYDVIFYYPQHFNRGNKNKNNYFKNLIESCKDKGLRFIVFEEPDFYMALAGQKHCPIEEYFLKF